MYFMGDHLDGQRPTFDAKMVDVITLNPIGAV
jgi:hypothetical protein